MKISFQNPTRGPLITVSLDDDAGATTAFVPAVADCAARVTSKHIIATEGTASIAGPLALVGMLFASGDTSPKPASPDPIYPAPSPGRHRCLLNPYDLSAECAAVRSQHASPPIDTADHVAPRVGVPLASAGGRKTEPVATTTETRLAVDLPTAATPTHDSIAAILEGNPPATGPWGMGWMHIPEMVASGETRYPRLEALVAHLLAGKTSPHIVERGPGMYSALSIALARHYRITVIEKIKNGYAPNYDSVPQAIRANITFLDVAQAPARATADLAIWIHPITDLMKDDDDILDLAFMGQDVVAGGYLVIQTEVQHYGIHPEPDWEVIHDNRHHGFLAPSQFANFSSRTIILRRTPIPLPSSWDDLAQTNPNVFAVQAHALIMRVATELSARIEKNETIGRVSGWYVRSILPDLELANTAFKLHFPKRYTERRDQLSRVLMIMTYTIPVFLEEGDLNQVKLRLSEVLR